MRAAVLLLLAVAAVRVGAQPSMFTNPDLGSIQSTIGNIIGDRERRRCCRMHAPASARAKPAWVAARSRGGGRPRCMTLNASHKP